MPKIKIDKTKKVKTTTFDIIEDLKELTEPRSIVLIGHNYLNFVIDNIFLQHFLGIRDSNISVGYGHTDTDSFEKYFLNDLPFRRKIFFLNELKIIDKTLHDKLSRVNDIRNKVAHDFTYHYTENNAKNYKDKCIALYQTLSKIRDEHFKNMHIYDCKY